MKKTCTVVMLMALLLVSLASCLPYDPGIPPCCGQTTVQPLP